MKRGEKRADATPRDPRWAAVVRRDPRADGQFVYAVTTTGVYCRPSCGSRLARPENVRFFATRAAAEHAGFRPCRRCKPGEAAPASLQAAKVTAACRYIETAAVMPALRALAARAEMSPRHFHRVFKAGTGLTPRAYAAAHRARRVRDQLARGGPITDAIYSAGYGSSGRFYETSSAVLGMTPGRFRAGGAGAEIRYAVGACSLGSLLVAQSRRGICAILLGEDPEALARELHDRFPRARLIGGDRQYEKFVAKVVAFVERPAIGLDLPLDVRGTAFQQRVWQALRRIPAGKTASYAEIAKRIGSPGSARAVASACAANTLAVAIPCHRVVRKNGDLSGYRWGVERKRALLKREARAQPVRRPPKENGR